MGAMVRFKRETGRDVSTIQSGDLSDLALLLWCCVKSACNADGVGFEDSFELFSDSLDAEALQGFTQGLAAQEAGDKQKKRTGTKK